jgi:hypothetical protein
MLVLLRTCDLTSALPGCTGLWQGGHQQDKPECVSKHGSLLKLALVSRSYSINVVRRTFQPRNTHPSCRLQ